MTEDQVKEDLGEIVRCCEGVNQASRPRDNAITQIVQHFNFLGDCVEVKKGMVRLVSASDMREHQLSKAAQDLAQTQVMFHGARSRIV